MKYVLDSSVAFKWEVAEDHADKAIQLRDEAKRGLHELLAPDIFPVEIAHALTRAERQKRITPVEGKGLIADAMNNLPPLHSYMPLLMRAYNISSANRVGVYD